jgi:bifunctional non-homologous end joining protein LigD
MLATLATESSLDDEHEWAFEMKWDGVRIVAYLSDGRVKLLSRSGRDDTAAYFELAEPLAALGCTQAVLDGEIVVTDVAGVPRFSLLQPRINLSKPAEIAAAAARYPVQLMLFDLLQLDGRSLIRQPYEERRLALETLVPAQPGSRVQVPPVFEGDLAAALHTSLTLELEGVMAKRRGSIYQPGQRAHTWLKIKHRRTQSVVVGGWRPGKGNRAGGIGSLLLAIPGPEGMRYAGRVGTGFSTRSLAEAKRKLAPLARPDNPLLDVPREDAGDAYWVEPTLVGEVDYSDVSDSGRLRHPVWRGWRPDLAPTEVTWERPEPQDAGA